MMAHPGDQTVRMLVPSGYDASDSSDGIPQSSDDCEAITPAPCAVIEIASEPTRRLPVLTLGQTFAVLLALQGTASGAGLDLEIDPMPAIAPSGVHLWCDDHGALCRWLERERQRHFACVHLSDVVPDDLLEAAMFLLESLATGMPLAKVISVGHKRFVHLAFRSGQE